MSNIQKRKVLIELAIATVVMLKLAGCAPIISSDKAITSFAFLASKNPGLAADYTGVISGTYIRVSLPLDVDRRSLVATFAATGAQVEVDGRGKQVSGESPNDFSAPLAYVVVASDGTAAAYTVDATAVKKVIAADAVGGDWFGLSVSISGDYAIVGAPGVDAADPVEPKYNAGAVWVFNRTGPYNTWNSWFKIMSLEAAADGHFGQSVSISGDYVIVGANEEYAGGLPHAGAAYVFRRTGSNIWDSGVQLVAPDAEGGEQFGYSVSISEDYTIVGAVGENARGVNAGAVYVFRRTGSNSWDDWVKLVAFDGEAGDEFGSSVSISGDYAIVGAQEEDEGGDAAGAAYVFYRTDTNSWDSVVKLTAQDAGAGDCFGRSVSINGEYAIVGAIGEDTGGANAGAAYVFHRSGTNSWDFIAKLKAPDAEAEDVFGEAVSISGQQAIVGAPGEDTRGDTAGAAYVFHRTGSSSWDSGVKLLAEDGDADDCFGGSVSISGDFIIVGAKLADAAFAGAGATYFFY